MVDNLNKIKHSTLNPPETQRAIVLAIFNQDSPHGPIF
jgi:hypothetical protein